METMDPISRCGRHRGSNRASLLKANTRYYLAQINIYIAQYQWADANSPGGVTDFDEG